MTGVFLREEKFGGRNTEMEHTRPKATWQGTEVREMQLQVKGPRGSLAAARSWRRREGSFGWGTRTGSMIFGPLTSRGVKDKFLLSQ